MKSYDNRPVIFIGDVHGDWCGLKRTIKNHGVKDCYLICVGDLGIGFSQFISKERRVHTSLNEFFLHHNIKFMSIRGNHDDPKYFVVDPPWKFSNFELIPDYSIKVINGEKYQFVGGAISIDRKCDHRKAGSTYWLDEVFDFKPELAEKCDVLVTHSSPSWSGPVDKNQLIRNLEARDYYLWRDCIAERKDHDLLYAICQPHIHYAGHFHNYYFTKYNNSTSVILDILQLKEHTAYKNERIILDTK